MSRIADDITRLIGHTPLVKLNRLTGGLPGQVIVKLESFNPLSSVKDRIGISMIDAKTPRRLRPGQLTSG